MRLAALHLSLLMEANRNGSVHPATKADRVACSELRRAGYLDADNNITSEGRMAAQGERE